jgi:invasion protein IalB
MRIAKIIGTLAVIGSLTIVDGLHAEVGDRPAMLAQAQQQQPRQQRNQPANPPPAQQQPANSPPPAAAAPAAPVTQAPAGPAWTSQCSSAARNTAPECVVSQTAFLTQTGQMIAAVSVRVPPNTKQPVMMVHVPVGLFIPAGIGIQVDEGKVETLAIQTCDLKGCYAGNPMSPELLASMKSGKRFSVTFKNLNQQTITVPLTLAQFAEAYANIQ